MCVTTRYLMYNYDESCVCLLPNCTRLILSLSTKRLAVHPQRFGLLCLPPTMRTLLLSLSLGTSSSPNSWCTYQKDSTHMPANFNFQDLRHPPLKREIFFYDSYGVHTGIMTGIVL
jgi:hypothetical protein